MSVCRLLALAAAVAAELPLVAFATAEAMASAVTCAMASAAADVEAEPLPDDPVPVEVDCGLEQRRKYAAQRPPLWTPSHCPRTLHQRSATVDRLSRRIRR